MTSSESNLPQDLAACQALIEQLRRDLQADAERIAQLEAELAQHQQTIVDQQQTIGNLQADNQLLKRALFGSRRERYVDDPRQGLLFDAAELDAAATTPSASDDANASADAAGEQGAPPETRKKRTSKGRRRRVFPQFFPREQVRHQLKDDEIPDELRNDPNARRFFKKTGEHLEWIPPQFKVIEVYQETIAVDQPTGQTVMITASQPQLINAFTGPSIWSYLTVSRFADHLPYYRLEDILGRSGFRIERSTQWRWMHALARGVTPLVELMRLQALQSYVLGADETLLKMLGGPGRTLTAYLWALVGDDLHPYDCFYFTPDRRAAGPHEFLAGYRGYLQADAYIAYETLPELQPEIVRVACWAHGRRKFEEVHHLGPTKRTHTALAYIQRLYEIEDLHRQSTEQERFQARQHLSLPIVQKFHQWLQEEAVNTLPKSKFRGAANYMLNRWESFARYLESGAIPIDNNRTEATLKYAILGRKSWLFVGNCEAGETAAKLFTLTKTCNRLHIDPLAYLQDVYTRLPSTSPEELSSLLPDQWIAAHPQHLVEQRVQESVDRARRTRERRAARRRTAA